VCVLACCSQVARMLLACCSQSVWPACRVLASYGAASEGRRRHRNVVRDRPLRTRHRHTRAGGSVYPWDCYALVFGRPRLARHGFASSEKTPTCGGDFARTERTRAESSGRKFADLWGVFGRVRWVWPSPFGLAESAGLASPRLVWPRPLGLAASARSGRVRSVWPKSTFAGWRQMNCRPR